MKTVLVLLPSSQASSQAIHCWKLSDNGEVLQETWMPDSLSAQQGIQCVVMLPASCLSWPVVTVPVGVKMQGDGRLLPVLQGLAEEQLLEDADNMHLALPPDAHAGNSLTLAACDKAWLANWMQLLERAGIKVLRVIPELAPDVLDDALWATGQDHDVWVAGMQASTPVIVPLDGAMAVFGTPQKTVNALPSVYTPVSKQLGEKQVQLVAEPMWLQAQLQTRWNLAQHSFAGTWVHRWKRKASVWWNSFFHAQEWRAARVACASLGIGMALVVNVQAWRQQQALQQQRDAITRTVQQTFPQLLVLVDAPLQMQRELDRLRRDMGVLSTSDFEPMASAVGNALRALNLHVSGMQYHKGSLLLDGLPSAQLAAINARLQSSGYRADMDGQSMRVQEAR